MTDFIINWLAFTPDFQYVVNPGSSGENDDAVVAALRISMDF